MVAFLPDALYYDYRYPISVLRISPANRKFAEDLSHRDFLGGILNLGIERSCLGDLLVEDSVCHVFVTDAMADFICDQLTRIRHTVVRTEKIDETAFSFAPRLETIKGTVASVRLDTVLSVAFPMSRSRLTGLIEGGKVFVNGKADHLQRIPPEGGGHYLCQGHGQAGVPGHPLGDKEGAPVYPGWKIYLEKRRLAEKWQQCLKRQQHIKKQREII